MTVFHLNLYYFIFMPVARLSWRQKTGYGYIRMYNMECIISCGYRHFLIQYTKCNLRDVHRREGVLEEVLGEGVLEE